MLPMPISARALSQTFRRSLPKYFSQLELHQILSDELRQSAYTDWFLIFFLSRFGCRISEVLLLTVADIDFANRVLSCPTLKRHRHHRRSIPFSGETAGVIAEYLTRNNLQRHDFLFPFTRKTAFLKVKKACRQSGLSENDERCHPHTLRHTFAVNAVINGIPLPVLQVWLGHRDIYNTLIYTQILAVDSHQFMDNIRW